MRNGVDLTGRDLTSDYWTFWFVKVPEDIADKYAVLCVFDPDAEFGVSVQDERIRNHVIDTFANLGIPERRIYGK